MYPLIVTVNILTAIVLAVIVYLLATGVSDPKRRQSMVLSGLGMVAFAVGMNVMR